MALSHQQEPAKRREVRREHHGTTELPTHQIPERGLGLGDAYEYISAELLLDGHAQLNLATFVTTYMPVSARSLMAETADKNMIDKDEDPLTAAIEERCVNILAELWHSPEAADATGWSTTASSDACMLADMAI